MASQLIQKSRQSYAHSLGPLPLLCPKEWHLLSFPAVIFVSLSDVITSLFLSSYYIICSILYGSNSGVLDLHQPRWSAKIIFFIFLQKNMFTQMNATKDLIQYLEDREDEVENEIQIKAWYKQALSFLNDYLTDVQDELDHEYADKYNTVESYYYF